MQTAIGYLVHDLNDAAVERRVRALSCGGASVRIAGFYRREPISELAGSPASPLGRSEDARLLDRALLVSRILLSRNKLGRATKGAQVIIARNLEMLILAARVRSPGQRLVYECLDIHRLMLRRNPLGSLLRAIERALLRRCDLVLTSSPAFIERYFRSVQGFDGPVALVENKVLGVAGAAQPGNACPAGRPWRIGWFGMLRCARSLEILRRLAQEADGAIEIVLAGRPARTELPDFDEVVRTNPAMHYLGPYRAEDLPRLYSSVHFAWLIDYFDEGENSDWLLPNRLYESVANGCVPIGLAPVESGRWMARQSIGLRIEHPDELAPFLSGLDARRYRALREKVKEIPEDRTIAGARECRSLVEQIAGPS